MWTLRFEWDRFGVLCCNLSMVGQRNRPNRALQRTAASQIQSHAGADCFRTSLGLFYGPPLSLSLCDARARLYDAMRSSTCPSDDDASSAQDPAAGSPWSDLHVSQGALGLVQMPPKAVKPPPSWWEPVLVEFWLQEDRPGDYQTDRFWNAAVVMLEGVYGDRAESVQIRRLHSLPPLRARSSWPHSVTHPSSPQLPPPWCML